ncbi:MAG: diguanylate cyclase [Rhodothermales bacterium]|nr:diguanylate cyclase [Rhodothermales bacterium]
MTTSIRMKDRGTILVVDDEQVVFDSLELFLEGRHDLLYASNAAQGMQIARSQRLDLILLDIGMPDINGYKVCRMLKHEPETTDIPVIFLTAFASPNDEVTGLEAGAVDYIVKPINPAILRARVHTHISLKIQRDYLELLVRQDSLTSLINRRGFDELLNREWCRAARGHSPLTVVIIDVDSFKAYNDTYGHIAGDVCLQRVSSSLTSVLHRAGDYLFRYGGEEFAALLADTPFEFVPMMAERLRLAVQNAQIPHAQATTGDVLTISVGAATIIPNYHDNSMTLVEAADRMLYQAKESGRNCVQVVDLGESGDAIKPAA